MESPFQSWTQQLSKGDLIGVCYNNWFDVVVFDSFRSNNRMHFYHLCWSNANKEHIDWKMKRIQESKLSKSYINTCADKRVFPIGKEMLSDGQKQIYNALKEKLNGY